MVLEKERKKKTRIVCTIGPASEDKKVLTKLVQAGMNVMRLNFSHGDFEEHGGRIKTLREINKELNKRLTRRKNVSIDYYVASLGEVCND